MGTFSIQYRLRRTIVQDAFVNVRLTNAVMSGPGDRPIDPAAFDQAALAYASEEGVEWRIEAVTVEPHPSQVPLPEGRTRYEPAGDIDWWEGELGGMG
ncbi:MAG: hypothetical protein LBC97_04950 [Bifidobacteriaceae bacterium]|jgi:hypothetical protein|nr:hypothetical protein [Bifidobacteriaceae bacterium]